MNAYKDELDFGTQLETKVAGFKGSTQSGEGIVEAIVAVTGNVDRVNDIIKEGAFTESIERMKPKAVWGHDWNQPVGKVLEIKELKSGDPKLPEELSKHGLGGLWCKIKFCLPSSFGRDAYEIVKMFDEDQEWSVGYKVKNEHKRDPVTGANILTDLELYEVSPVLHGANKMTSTLSVKSLEEQKVKSEREHWLKSNLEEFVGSMVKILRVERDIVFFETSPGQIRMAKIMDDTRRVDVSPARHTMSNGQYVEVKDAANTLSLSCSPKDSAHMLWALSESDMLVDIQDTGIDIKFGGSEPDQLLAEVAVAMSELDEVPNVTVWNPDLVRI